MTLANRQKLTAEQDEFLRTNWPSLTILELGQRLKRNEAQIVSYARRLKLPPKGRAKKDAPR